MAEYLGSVKGARGEVTRLGNKRSGMTTEAASWGGSVRVYLWEHESGVTWCRVGLNPWHGAGVSHLLYEGPVSHFAPGGITRKGA
jgi:hypothetical protein